MRSGTHVARGREFRGTSGVVARLAAVVVAGALGAHCSGDGGTPVDPGDDGIAPDVGPADGGGETLTDAPTDAPGTGEDADDGGADAEPGDVPGDEGAGTPDGDVGGDASGGFPACEEGGEPGCPCDQNSDCFEQWCVPGPEGLECTRTCEEECPDGYSCRPVSSGDRDTTFVCLYDHILYCRPCEVNADCAPALLGSSGASPHQCLEASPSEGSFCATACSSDEDCPGGATCQDVEINGETTQLCRPSEGGSCGCTQAAIDAGATTTCRVENEHGTCEGERQCTEDGLTDCDAPTPAAETCNGEDDDCDGKTDEAFPEQGEACDGDDADECEDGTYLCQSGSLVCDDDEAASSEVCNGEDDDCDGKTDEAFPELGEACDGDDGDQCTDGTLVCEGGSVVCDDDDEGATELCNGEDDDCDGKTDEAFPDLGTACDGNDADQCPNGEVVCTDDGSGTTCDEPLEANVSEVCNGEDDDCDGKTDEAFPELGQPCDGPDADECPDGEKVCSDDGTGTTCDEAPNQGKSELCNGEDDDCDGKTDEDFPVGETCDGEDEDLCANGELVCSDDGSSTVCVEDVTNIQETCNGKDDDCDELTDEDFPQLGEACDGPDSDQCKNGTKVCAEGDDATSVVCDEAPDQGIVEVCNGDDDDCDENVDERFRPEPAGTGEIGLEDPHFAEDAGKHKLANCGTGACSGGTVRCDPDDESALYCTTEDQADDEICDGVDNDCDGWTDEPFRPVSSFDGEAPEDAGTATPYDGGPYDPDAGKLKGESCGTGACSDGEVVCSMDGLALTCDSLVEASEEEICDFPGPDQGPNEETDVDDDCDGIAEEGCPAEGCLEGDDSCDPATKKGLIRFSFHNVIIPYPTSEEDAEGTDDGVGSVGIAGGEPAVGRMVQSEDCDPSAPDCCNPQEQACYQVDLGFYPTIAQPVNGGGTE